MQIFLFVLTYKFALGFRPELEHYVVPSTVNLGPGKKYEVIGSIINGTTANVKTYSGTFVQLQDKRVSIFSIDDYQQFCFIY